MPGPDRVETSPTEDGAQREPAGAKHHGSVGRIGENRRADFTDLNAALICGDRR